MFVVLYTDASYRQWVRSGTYAFWAKSDAGKIKYGGKFKCEIEDSTHAELNCIANALFSINSQWPGYTRIKINTDSLIAKKILSGERTHVPQKWQSVYQFIKNLLINKVAEFSHVKAHQDDSGIATWLNNWCDSEARKHWNRK